MLVKNWMHQPVITVEPTDTVATANHLMDKHRIRALPVMSDGKLVGIVTDRDLKQASASNSMGLELPKMIYLNTRIKMNSVMTMDVITVSPDMTVDEVAKILLDKRISGTPVVDNSGQLVGMITYLDIARLMISLAGIEKKGIQIAVQISTAGGTVRVVADIVRGLGGDISSLLTSYENVPEGFRKAYLKVFNVQPEKMDDLIRQLQEKAKILYIMEHSGDGKSPKTWVMNV